MKKSPRQLPSDGENKIELFQKSEVRKVYHEGEWWFALNDIIKTLTGSTDPAQYLKKLRKQDPELSKLFSNVEKPVEKGGVHFLPPLPLPIQTPGGIQNVSCWNVEGIFRLIQSIPSKKAEPFKRWLAKVGFERIQEIENPDLAIKRAKILYRAKGYSDEWIESRITNKTSRLALTDIWKEYGIEKAHHIAILTDAVSIEALGINTSQHKELKGLLGQNLRDHMTPIELTLMTLGEQATTEIVKAKKPRGIDQHQTAAVQGGSIAGNARKQIESATGRPVISKENYLTDRQKTNNAKKLAELTIKKRFKS